MLFFQIRFAATIVYYNLLVIQFVTRKERKREKERILEDILTIRRIKKKVKTAHTQNCSLAKQILSPNILLRKIIFMQLRK